MSLNDKKYLLENNCTLQERNEADGSLTITFNSFYIPAGTTYKRGFSNNNPLNPSDVDKSIYYYNKKHTLHRITYFQLDNIKILNSYSNTDNNMFISSVIFTFITTTGQKITLQPLNYDTFYTNYEYLFTQYKENKSRFKEYILLILLKIYTTYSTEILEQLQVTDEKSTVEQLTEEITRLNQELEDLTQANTELTSNLETCQTANTNLSNINHDLTTQVTNLTTRLNTVLADIDDGNNPLVTELNDRKYDYQVSLAHIPATSSITDERVLEDINELNNIISNTGTYEEEDPFLTGISKDFNSSDHSPVIVGEPYYIYFKEFTQDKATSFVNPQMLETMTLNVDGKNVSASYIWDNWLLIDSEPIVFTTTGFHIIRLLFNEGPDDFIITIALTAV